MRLLGRFSWLACALAIGGASCGVLGPQPDHTRYAVLVSVDELSGAAPHPSVATSSLLVGLGPIALPEYLRRTAIVSREGGTRLVPSTTETWAEPLDRSLERVLAIDLRREAKVGCVILHPWYETERPEVQVEIDFARCERDLSLGVVVAARWRVSWLDKSRAPLEREARVERPCASPDGATVAMAISEALAELAQQIGASL